MKQIPDDLSGVYRELFEEIKKGEPPNQELARRAVSWVFGAQTQLRADEFIKAISSGYENYKERVTVDDIISCCHHLLLYNASSDRIEFGHFSVVQFIEKEKKEEYGHSQVHGLMSFLCLNAMWEAARVNDKGFRLDHVENYVHGLTKATVVGKDSENSRRTFVSFWCYATNFWAFHCEGSGADSGTQNTWENPLRWWCEIKQVVSRIPFAEDANVSLGVNSIGYRIPEGSAENFSEWIFMISCKPTPCHFRPLRQPC